MKITFADLSATLPKAPVLVFPVAEDKKLPASLAALDKKAGGVVAKALGVGRFMGKKKEYIAIPAVGGYDWVVLAGIGKPAELKPLCFQAIGGGLVPHLNSAGAKAATFVLELPKGVTPGLDEAAANLAFGAQLRSYRFDKYRTKEKPENKPTLTALTVATPQAKAAQAAYAHFDAVAGGVFLTRNLVSEPANVVYPESFADECKKLSKLGVEVNVVTEEEMYKLGMGALLGVGQGSARESLLVTMRWNGAGAKSKTAPLAFVGKGVTFDTGGISIKPAQGMEDMKYDMGGAGAVIGLMHALASRKAKVNVVGVCGLVENMPDGNAQRPGDVVTSMSGQTIEVINTDAEGRLVLADALWYTQETFKPRFVINLATLTGAIVIALGTSRAGLFSNDDALAGQIFAAGEASGEEVWRFPMGDVYDKQINSEIADMQNTGNDRGAGSITAAQFLKRFIKEGTPWAHLDIAGMAWARKDKDTCPKGAAGFGVQLLDRLVSEYYEG